MKTLPALLFSAALLAAPLVSAQKISPTAPLPGTATLAAFTAKGVQIYTCQQVDSTPQWFFKAPEATLFDEKGNSVGTHSAGPLWKYKDGSTVKGEVMAKDPAPVPDSIPWLLLKAVNSQGSGFMSRVESIRRTNTHGGIAPASGCDADHLNTSVRVPYTATYSFYSSRP